MASDGELLRRLDIGLLCDDCKGLNMEEAIKCTHMDHRKVDWVGPNYYVKDGDFHWRYNLSASDKLVDSLIGVTKHVTPSEESDVAGTRPAE